MGLLIAGKKEVLISGTHKARQGPHMYLCEEETERLEDGKAFWLVCHRLLSLRSPEHPL